MFGKKTPSSAPVPLVHVQTMPADFYGGVNPVVKFKRVEKEVILKTKPALSATEKIMHDKAELPGSGQPLHPVNLFTNRRYLIIGGVILFFIFVAGTSWYYLYPLWRVKESTLPATKPLTYAPPGNTSTNNIISETTTPPIENTTTTEPEPKFSNEAPMEFPSRLLGESVDLDRDDITDIAEEIFATDPSKPDSDEDSYNDGVEVYNLYNPIGKAPVKIIDSGLVKDFMNPVFGYQLYYPATWAVGNVDANYRDVLFSTITGENVEVRVFDLESGQNFTDWFARWAPNESFGDVVDFASAFKEKGMRRNDYLVCYFIDTTHVYIIVYHTTDSNIINFRSVIKMMARSFRLAGNSTMIKPQIIEGNISEEIASGTEASSSATGTGL